MTSTIRTDRTLAPPMQYPGTRDILFVLGAGASRADGSPLQADIIPSLIQGKQTSLRESEVTAEVLEFLERYYAWGDSDYPTLEAVFAFLDHLIHEERALSSDYTLARLRSIKESLVRLIFYVTGQSSQAPDTYRDFWNCVDTHSKNISILTLNYDSLLEAAFPAMYARNVYIDYCLSFLNESSSVGSWTNPQRWMWNKPDHPSPSAIKILKAHGSLNWKYCACCGQTMLTPWLTDIELSTGRFDQSAHCPHDQTPYSTLIVPPAFGKRLYHPVISRILEESASEIRVSKKIVFIGYSMREPDVHLKSLFHVNINPKAELIVIDKKISPTIKNRYKALSSKVQFIESPFEELVQVPELRDRIFGVGQ